MIKGLYAAASAMITGVYRQQAVAHDVANVNTPGFKQILTSLDEFELTSAYTQSTRNNVNQITYLGNMGLGVMAAPETTDFAQGTLKNTDSPLDLAISGEGFFRIRTPEGDRFTRDGRFSKDATGQLVTVDGNLVLSANGQPIRLAEGDPTISTNGDIFVNGVAGGTIGLAYFADLSTLTRSDENTFTSTATPATTGGGTIIQNTLEQSNVDSAQLMTQMIEISRSYQAAQKMVQNQDELLGKAISTLGRVS
ncbi:MAG: flagellar hook-basal body protein [Anaerolineae bacterium]|nr:flagellar hook-basal body protein [Anaerolineae bacterium]